VWWVEPRVLCQASIPWYCVFVLLDASIIIHPIGFVTLHLRNLSLQLGYAILQLDSTSPLLVE